MIITVRSLFVAIALAAAAAASAVAQPAPPAIEREPSVSKPTTTVVGLMPGLPLGPHEPHQSMVIGYLDSGVDREHPQIRGLVVAERDFTGEGLQDPTGHGTTAVLSGLRPFFDSSEQAQILRGSISKPAGIVMAKVVGVKPVPTQTTVDRMIEGVRWLGELGVRSVNISIALPAGAADFSKLCEVLAEQTETFFAIAAGNAGPQATVYPAGCAPSNALVVGAVTSDGTVPEYSGRADLVAPLPPAPVPAYEYFRREAEARVQADDLEGATIAYAQAAEADPPPEAQALIHYGLGHIAARQQDWPLSEREFWASIDLWPQYPESYVALSWTLTERSDFEGARALLERGLQAGADSARMRDRLVRVMLDLDLPREAVAHLEKLQALDPQFPDLDLLRRDTNNRVLVLNAVQNGTDPGTFLTVFAETGDAHLVRFVARRFRVDLDAVPEGYKVPPIVAAAAGGHRAVVAVLLESGGGVDALDPKYRLTALMMAANNGDVVLLDRLIAAGAGLDLADYYGFTPLMFAAEQGHEDAVRLLIKQGADLTPRSEDGLSALDYARMHGHDEIASAILGDQRSAPTR